MSQALAATRFAQVRVRAAGADAVTTRQRLERLLAALDLRPRSLSPHAILCVRELRDPLPGVLSLEGHATRLPETWAQAMQREVERFARDAAWPAQGAVPAGAGAVAFADEAELIGCLGSDLLHGSWGGRWWWPLLVPGASEPRKATVARWFEAGAYVPAALQWLSERRLAVRFAKSLERDEVRRLIARVSESFGLPAELSTGEQQPVAAWPVPQGDEDRAWEVAAPWIPWVPEAAERGLSPEHQELLGVALTLARAPGAGRSRDFIERRAAFRLLATATSNSPSHRAPPMVRPSTTDPEPPTLELSPLVSTPHRTAATTPAPRPANAADSVQSAGTRLPWSPSVSSPPRPELFTGVLEPRRDSENPSLPEVANHEVVDSNPDFPPQVVVESGHLEGRFETSPGPPEGAPAEATLPGRPPAARAPQRLLSLRARSRLFGAPTKTQLGGVFYLINVALYLGLYGDEDNITLSLWDFVELLGRQLAAGYGEDDPIWQLLAALAGRNADEAATTDLDPGPNWRVPPRWLSALPPKELRYAEVDGRLLVEHDAGFVLLDVAAEPNVVAQLARELDHYPDLRAVALADSELVEASRACGWIERLAAYARARLIRALDVEADQLPQVLLAHSARVHVTETHLDVVLSLETLPVAIRLAGLDRDPGWVGAGGRFIAFHFE